MINTLPKYLIETATKILVESINIIQIPHWLSVPETNKFVKKHKLEITGKIDPWQIQEYKI